MTCERHTSYILPGVLTGSGRWTRRTNGDQSESDGKAALLLHVLKFESPLDVGTSHVTRLEWS